MYALNRAQIIGHLTEDPQIRQTPSGQTVGDLNIVTRQIFVNSNGEKQPSSSYHNVVVWRGLADISGRFLKKGSQIYISGRIQTDEWEDQSSGQKRYKTRITADEMILLDPKTPNGPIAQGSHVETALNQAEVIGNITKDPELRQTPNGSSVVSFGVATNFSWKDKSGVNQEKTEFHNIVAWGDLATSIQQNFTKGKKIYVAGRLQTRSWETQDGSKRYTTEIIAERALALGIPDMELGAPAAGERSVSFSAPQAAGYGAAAGMANNPFAVGQQASTGGVVPQNPSDVPAVNYESDVKPEDLPF